MRHLQWRIAAVAAFALALLIFPVRPVLAGNLQPPVTLSLVPSTQSVQPGQQFTVSVFLDMPSSTSTMLSPHLIDFVSMEVHWDPAVLTAVNFQPVNPPFSTIEGPVIDNTTGTAAIDEGTGPDPTNVLQKAADVATLTFQADQANHSVSPINWVKAQALSTSSNDQASENVVGVAYGSVVCVDSAVPACKRLAPAASIQRGKLGTNGVKVKLAWGATDADGVSSYQLQQSTNGGTFTTVTLPSATATSITRSLTSGNGYQFQARYTDALGNTSSYAIGPGFEVDNNGNSTSQAFLVKLYDDTTTAATFTSGWSSAALSGAYGGTVHDAASTGNNVQFAVRSTDVAQSTGVSLAQSLAWVSAKGPDRGKAAVWLDGVKVATVDLYASALQTRQVVWSTNVNASRDHTLEIQVLGTKNPASSGTRVDVDAFVLLR